MLYLNRFTFPDEEREWDFRMTVKITCVQSIYPFYVLPQRGLREICFRPITILYGGNGSGKSTALNVIAEKLGLERSSDFNRTVYYQQYTDLCEASLEEDEIPPDSRIITSDDVFDYMLNVRALNTGIENHREQLMNDYQRLKHEKFQLRGMEDYEELRRVNRARSKTLSRFVDSEGGETVRERSNGESALMYFREKIMSDTLCLLDEPENSLSPQKQLELADYLVESVRYCGCQLIISTHSPFLLAMPGARIIDLDHGSVIADSWTELDNVRAYYDFFQRHKPEFDKNGR